MELRVYDADLNLQGISENQTSIQWKRKYFEAGSFEIHLPLTNDNISLYRLGNIVSFRETVEAGVIEDIQMIQSAIDRYIVVKGRFLASYMDRRLIRPTINFRGKVEVAMRSLLTGAVSIPHVQLGELNNFPETVEFQATYKNLLDYESKLSKAYNIGFRFRPDFTNKVIYFETYKGLDKSRNQSDRAFVEFSDKFDNLNKATYRDNDQLLKTVGYVGGQGEGSQRVFVIVGNDSLVGLERRELFIDAKDLSSEDLTDAQYKAALRERGVQSMNDCLRSKSLDCETIPSGNYNYLTDYNLGDIVTVRKTQWGLSEDLRITEISEVYERGNAKIVPTLGSPLPTKIDWEDK